MTEKFLEQRNDEFTEIEGTAYKIRTLNRLTWHTYYNPQRNYQKLFEEITKKSIEKLK